ncbi:8-oxo-dGTP pyrophosphatase MutT (NUDIX family) [Kitasatospora herbaricolor]|uniref:NUDIX hydrolase n=1 Tax=Kitasatospora herbaricolor TaxID=68217 RepID=UPI0017486F02|nr:NUDIX domain-containing protein [Kitasatospora herbaricolor]MDQ0307319.1 8-oxo-dGTP pyrophosphatase MutT (NUDIX family) [Kitasatospora herbaricolor]
MTDHTTPAAGLPDAAPAGASPVPADPAEELLDVVDAQDRVTGTAPRREVYRLGLTHRCVFILVRNPQGRIFVHRRTDTKMFAPGAYDMFVGGVVGAGETYEVAAVREAEEELGVSGVRPRPLFKYLFEQGRLSWWCDVYEAVWDGPVAPQVEEVAWHDWLTEAELAARLTEWDFVPDGREAYRRYLEFAAS